MNETYRNIPIQQFIKQYLMILTLSNIIEMSNVAMVTVECCLLK